MTVAIESALAPNIGAHTRTHTERGLDAALRVHDLSVTFNGKVAVRDVSMEFARGEVTALIGPSGCGKTTLLRSLNRMHDLTPGARVSGSVTLGERDVYGADTNPIEIRTRIGMVFQRPNPFPTMNVYDNVAAGLKLNGIRNRAVLDDVVERSLRAAALWESVSHKLKTSAMRLSGGEQQRLCIARALAVEPDVLLMDEPTSALDPIATAQIEELLGDMKQQVTIVIVTHNMQQALRVSDSCGFFMVDEERAGRLVEQGATRELFTNPREARTRAYVTGEFG